MSQIDDELQKDIKKVLEEHFLEGMREGFKKGLEEGEKGFVSSNPEVFGKFQEVHDSIFQFAIKTNIASREKYNPPSELANHKILSRSCSFKIGEWAVVLFRASFLLCEDGWATVVPILHRSLVECLLNSYLILKEHNDYWAFRFFAHGFLNSLVSSDNDDVKKEALREIDKLLLDLKGSDLKRANEYRIAFLNTGKRNNYWYKPEFANVGIILPQRLYGVYKDFSESIHSSLIGMDLFKDNAAEISINPRNDPKSIKLALVGSMRILQEITNMRIQHESLELTKESEEQFRKINDLKPFM